MLRRIFLLVAAIGLILAGLIFIVPFALPANTIKNQIEKLIFDNTGWRIRFGGDVTMALIPSVRLVAKDIEVSPPGHKPILKADEARFAVGLQALFSGAVDIEEVYLNRPDLTVELGASGNPVWLPEETPSGTSPATPAGSPSSTNPAQDGAGDDIVRALVETLRVQRLAIDDATIRFGTIDTPLTEIRNITFAAALPDPQGALNIDGSATFEGDVITLKSELPAFKNLVNTSKGSMRVEIAYKNAKLLTNGTFDLHGATKFDGTIGVDIADISQIAGADTLAPGVVKANGTVVAGQNRVEIIFAQSQFMGTTFASNIVVETDRVRPLVTGAINLGALDIDTLQPASINTAPPSANSGSKKNRAAPDLSGARAIDANLSFSIASIKTGPHLVENLKGGLILNDGVAEFKINELTAAGGVASLTLNADTKAAPLVTFGSLGTRDLSVATLLALAGQDQNAKQVKGLLGSDLQFGFQGLAIDEITHTLNARGYIDISRASVSGLGLASTFNDPAADTADAISLRATIDGLSNPLSLKGAARWRGETIRLEVSTNPGALIAGQKAKTRANVSLSKVTATFTGDVSSAIPASGTIAIQGKSLRALASWLGSELPPGNGYGRFDIKTGFSADEKKIALNDLSVTLDDIKGNGNAKVLLGTIPDITANISFDLLDVNPYIATPASAAGGSNGAPNNSSTAWSREPIDFSFMRAANLDLTARVNTLKAEGLSVGPLSLKTTMRGGKLTADLGEMQFYGGLASAKVVVDAANPTPTLAAKLSAKGVQAYPFLRDAAQFERIECGLDYGLDVTTSGNTQAAIVSALNGQTSFNFRDGAIRGINIAKVMRSLTGGALNGWNTAASEKTDFSAFNASFDIPNGVATNRDLNLVGPLVRVSGEGIVQMPPQTLKYRINPKVVASLQGQGGKQDLAGFAVPIIIEGPWAKPKIYPDIKGFLQDPAAGLATLRSLGGGFEQIASGKTGDLLGALGSDPKGAAVAKVGEALKNKTGVDVGGLLKDGKISKEGGAAAVVGALGGLLGGANRGSGGEQPALALTPLQAGEIPVPRARPGVVQRPASPVTDIVNQVVRPKGANEPNQPGLPVNVPKDADKLIRGLGGLLGGSRN